ncbi:hypothetical protein GCM10009632_54930 [Mycolicibacterium alvei]|uniref:Uncharacterized protein n=1 Tax=Mycolicibacterium alvei TaxID=67081 RepID=A0A6N4UZE8_9MYCO|nr:hypothetical protein MALV_45000 [Mycolicibacterium alvei]
MALFGRGGAVDPERSRLLALFGAAEQSCNTVQQSRFPGAGRSQQQHSLTGLDLKIEIAHGPGGTAGMAPPPVVRRDGGTAAVR